MVANNRGQLKIQQMAFMLLAVTLFFVLVGMFVLLIQFSGLQESAQILEQEEALLLVSELANSPEFSCGDAFQTSRSNCVDLDKVRALNDNINRYENSDFWGIDSIEVLEIYPEENRIEVFSKNENGIGVSNFVSLCEKVNEENEIYDKCEIGRLIVKYGG